MSKADERLIASLLPDPLLRERAVDYLELANAESPLWDGLHQNLARAVRRFERLQIATAYARLHRTDDPALERSQDLLTRKTALELLEALGDTGVGIAKRLDGIDLHALPNVVLRALASEVSETDALFEASGACRIAATRLETAIREAGDGRQAPMEMFTAHLTATASILQGAWADGLPGGQAALALLWVASLVSLGDLENDSTTEHYSA
ncbi:MAG: hypothetical protein H6737_31160 [Alphaproteobacteria bacterium]|nr:hypothetical protein [Alphaproteobacteria bacterium]